MTPEQANRILELSSTLKQAKLNAVIVKDQAMKDMALADNKINEAADNLRRYANGLVVNE